MNPLNLVYTSIYVQKFNTEQNNVSKVKFSLCLTNWALKHYTMKAYGGVEA
jgi:hypothetical protein